MDGNVSEYQCKEMYHKIVDVQIETYEHGKERERERERERSERMAES